MLFMLTGRGSSGSHTARAANLGGAAWYVRFAFGLACMGLSTRLPRVKQHWPKT